MRRGREGLEAPIRDAIYSWLRYSRPRWLVWRDKQPAKKAKCLFPESSGVADVLALTGSGRFIAIEVKRSEKLAPSLAQREFLTDVNRNGGLGVCVGSLEEARRDLEGIS